MAVFFNNSGSAEVITFNYNGSPLTTATFNDVEVFGDWVEYTFPNANAKLSASSYLGFDVSYSTPGSYALANSGNYWYPFGYNAGNEGDVLKLGFADGGNYKTFMWAFRVPSDWGEAKIKKVTISNAKNFNQYRIDGSNNRSAYSSINNSYDQSDLLPYHIFDLEETPAQDHTSYYSKTNKSSQDIVTPLSVIKISCTKPSTIAVGDDAGYIGRLQFTFSVSKSKLKTWAANYRVPLPSDIT